MKRYVLVLRNKSFAKLFIAMNLNTISQTFANVSIVWLLYHATNEPLLVALSGGVMMIPALISGTLLGGLIDRIKTVHALAIALFINAVVFLLLAVSPISASVVSIGLIFCLLSIMSLLTPLMTTSATIITNELLNGAALVTGNALLTIAFDLAYIIGSVLAGFFAASVYQQSAFLVAASFFLMTGMLTLSIKSNAVKAQRRERRSTTLAAGLHFIFSNIRLRNMVVLTSIWNMLIWGTLPVVLPLFVTHVLKQNSNVFGLLNSLQSVGIIIGSFVIGAITIKAKKTTIIYGGIVAQCLLLCLFGLQTQWLVASLLLIVAGIVSAPIMIYKTTYFQELIPNGSQGQLFMLISTLGTLLFPVGGLLIGSFAKVVAPSQIGSLLSAVCLLCFVIVFVLLSRQQSDLRQR